MKNNTSKVLTVVLSIIFMLSVLPVIPFTASAEVASGVCGNNLTWVLDKSTGVITISGTGEMYTYNMLQDIPWRNLRGDIKSIVIENGVTSIGGSAFSDCEEVVSISIPASVALIGNNASFFKCQKSLETITVDEENNTFKSLNNCLINTTNNTLILGCKNSIIPTDGSVTSIGHSAFSYCDKLETIIIPESVTVIENQAFAECNGLTEVKMPESLTSIGEAAFMNCSALTEIAIPVSVKEIKTQAFYGCEGITEISIPDGIETIPLWAFCRCTKLKKVIIPNSVKEIGSQAFHHDSLIETVLYYGSREQWDNISISEGNDYLLNATWHYNYVPHTPGDINGDGNINNKDLTRLFQYLSDWDVEVNEAALDINGDGTVNNKDLTRLFQYLSDWEVEIF